MKRLTYMILMLLLTVLASCKQSQADRYERYLESVGDSMGIDFITPGEDSIEIDPFDSGDESVLGSDDEGLVTVPDIPKERDVNMGSNDYELQKIMMGKE